MAATIKPHTLHLTYGSLTLLEGCLNDPGPCDTPAKYVEWADTQKKLRSANNYTVATAWGPQRVDKPVLMTEAEKQEALNAPAKASIAFQRRMDEFQDVTVKAWQDTAVTIRISDRVRECLRAAVKFVLEHQTDQKSRIRVDINPYWAQAIAELGLPAAKELPEDDGFEVVDDGSEAENAAPLTTSAAASA
jgi:hypothetical protein